MPRHCEAGFAYYSVETPAVFVERLLPIDPNQRDIDNRREWEKLLDLAERHGTHIHSSPYRRG